MEEKNTVPTTGQKEETTSQKTFTQDELDTIISERLKRDRSKYVDYEAIKDSKNKLETENAKLKEDMYSFDIYKKALEDIYEITIKDITNEKVMLIPDSDDIIYKLKYIFKNKQFLFGNSLRVNNLFTNNLPDGETVVKDNASLYEGKYKSLSEWAEADPRGYLKNRNKY